MTPQTVNAVQLPLQNAMNFPAAILEAPFFDAKADDAANYGSIGAVIGHEISHGFDNLGSEFDAEGRLRNWWTKDDAAHFKAATDKLVAQYDAYEALPGLHLSGKQTLGENIADVAGLQAAYTAYHKSLGGKQAPVIDGLSGDERFFLAFAQAWRAKQRDAALRAQVIGDGHAPARWRALTVRNIDAWYQTFKVPEGAKLYLKPEERVKIWYARLLALDENAGHWPAFSLSRPWLSAAARPVPLRSGNRRGSRPACGSVPPAARDARHGSRRRPCRQVARPATTRHRGSHPCRRMRSSTSPGTRPARRGRRDPRPSSTGTRLCVAPARPPPRARRTPPRWRRAAGSPQAGTSA